MKEFEIIIGIRAMEGMTDCRRICADTYEEAYNKALELKREDFDEDADAYIADIIEL